MPDEDAFPGPPPQKKGLPTIAIVLIVLACCAVLAIPLLAIIAAIAIPSLLRSRMAANQTAAEACCKAYAEAQEIYHRTDYNKDGVLEYATALSGNNSLLENRQGALDLCLIDRTFAAAEGQPSMQRTPKAGYCFKILTAQGAHATGGARCYIADGTPNMTLGYAFIAYPAAYDGTGRDCFIINNNGTIFQTDLGKDTPAIVEKMTEFDPDPKRWVPAE
jgi:type II secretory pathway pseudopilin PulG